MEQRHHLVTATRWLMGALCLALVVGCGAGPGEAPTTPPTPSSIAPTPSPSASTREEVPQVSLSAEQAAQVRAACVKGLATATELTVTIGDGFVGKRVDVCLVNPSDTAVELPVTRVDPWPSSESARLWIAESSPSEPLPADHPQIADDEVMVWVVDGTTYKGRVLVRSS
ncbi:hypothetical protein [Aestuariimicrobium ganziense]|uniref:hypothetical protein n=1 Tax=Aestuariimicrobium ganziense TaxID=2773677 RepID=UPI0019452447|nr:hypothetical protein [Aestuariimicrobium ganziense]